MNTLTMTPKKNFEANRLEAGLLQLTAGIEVLYIYEGTYN